MAHNIRGYAGREAAWHKLGVVTGKFVTWNEALADAKLDFVVFKSQLHDGLGRPVDAWGTFRWDYADRIASNKAAASFLGAVGKDYQVIQHTNGLKLVDKLMGEVDGAHYETLGALGNGERVWGMANLATSISVGGDKSEARLLFCTGHDGSLSHQYRIAFTRVVCQNTLAVALGEKGRSVFKVRHTKNAQDRIVSAGEALTALRADALTVEEKLNFLANRVVARESMTAVLDRLFPKTETEDGGEKSSTRRTNILGEILSLYESNDGNAFPEQRGTAYNLLNAITEYTDHVRATQGGASGRAESAIFGTGDALKAKALEVITVAAGSMNARSTRQQFVTRVVPPTPTRASLLDQMAEVGVATVGTW